MRDKNVSHGTQDPPAKNVSHGIQNRLALVWCGADGNGRFEFRAVNRFGQPNRQPPKITTGHAKRKRVARKSDFECPYCRRKLRPDERTLDHIVPKIQGGRNAEGNLVVACYRCNQAKGGRTPEQWAADILGYRRRYRESLIRRMRERVCRVPLVSFLQNIRCRLVLLVRGWRTAV